MAALVLASCSSAPGSHYTTEVDAERARAAWTDPWAAPSSVALPGVVYGSNGLLDREVGERTTAYPRLRTAEALALEVGAAGEHGWALVAVDCGAGTAVLTRGDSVDDGVLARVAAVPSGDGTGSEVGVELSVAHHLDGAWPALPPVSASRTCLGGAPERPAPAAVAEAVEDLDAGPLPGPDRVGDVDDDPDHEWDRDQLTDAEQALADVLADDPWVRADRPWGGPDLDEGDASRSAQQVEWTGGTERAGRDPRLVLRAALTGADGWEPTYAACSADGPAVATLRRVVGGTAAVARVEAVGDGTWTARVVMPVPEGPDPGWVADVPVLSGRTCLGGAPLGDGLTIEGVPVALPTSLTPYVG